MNPSPSCARVHRDSLILALAAGLVLSAPAQTNPTLLTSIPPMLAGGVSPAAPVVFKFSAAMDTTVTTATFMEAFTGNPLAVTPAWSADRLWMTNTPVPAFPTNTMIAWTVDGQDTTGDPLDEADGAFTTASGNDVNTSNTNRFTTFSVGTAQMYEQNTAFLTSDGYTFAATTTLASNRSATTVSVAFPDGTTNRLTQNQYLPWAFTYGSGMPVATNYAGGNYQFLVQGASSNQSVTVNLPASLAQPNAPKVSNLQAASAVDPSQPFTLTWGAFQGASATSLTVLEVDDQNGKPVVSNALASAATSFVIPAGTLQTNTHYQPYIAFENILGTTNSTQVSIAFRATITLFDLKTTAGAATAPLVLSNATCAGGVFRFQILSSPGQAMTLESSPTLSPASWSTFLVTNSPGQVQITAPVSASSTQRFYRVRKGT